MELHRALWQKASDAAVQAVLAAHPDAAKEKDGYGKLPLHYLSTTVAVVQAVLAVHPDAAKEKDGDGMLPLLCALALVNEASDAVVQAVLAAHPDAAKEKDGSGMLPLQYALAQKASDAVVQAVLATYPIASLYKVAGYSPLDFALARGVGVSRGTLAALAQLDTLTLLADPTKYVDLVTA